MMRRPPSSTRTATRFPDTTLVRSPAEACPALASPIESDGFVCDLYRALAFSVGELSVGRAPAPGSAVPGSATSRFRKRPSFVRSPQLSILPALRQAEPPARQPSGRRRPADPAVDRRAEEPATGQIGRAHV